MPAILNPQQRAFVSADGKIHGLVCRDGQTHYLLLVNGESTAQQLILHLPELNQQARVVGAWDGKVLARSPDDSQLSFEPLEVKVYRW